MVLSVALELGKTPREVAALMTPQELAEWMGFRKILNDQADAERVKWRADQAMHKAKRREY
jgi:hypothetical protein